MSSSKGAAGYIGRVGSLAVALGIGAAMATGTGVAWADGTDSGTGPSGQANAGTSAPSASSGPARRGSRGPAPAGSNSRSTLADSANDSVPDSRPDSTANPAAGTVDDIASVPRRPSNLPRAATAAESAGDPAVSAATTNNDAPARSPEPAATVIAPAASRLSPSPLVQSAAAILPQTVTTAPKAAAPQVSAVTPPVAMPVFAAAAVVAEAPHPPATQTATTAPRLVARLLSAIGLAPLAGSTTPGTPVDSPALWALLGWTRRDVGRAGVRTAAARTAQPTATVATALVATPSTLSSTPVGWVTGQRNTAIPGSGWTQTNKTLWANIYGTDLGIMWFNGDNGLTQLAFGDTFSGANMTGDWRSNVLLLSNDTNLSDGLSLINTGPAYQFIPAARNQVFFIGSEVTNIPTSAVYANGKNYVNYMSVKSWDTPGRWTTNYSAVSQYDPATDKWVLQPSTVRPAGYFRSSTAYQAGDQNFQQMAYVLEPESKVAPGSTRYVYAFGTPAGRAGSAYLSRVPENAVTDLKQYEYWDGSSWVRKQAYAAPIIGDSTKSTGLFGCIIDLANDPKFLGGSMAGFTGAKTGGNVSEMSVQYNEYLDKYVVLYGNGANNVILRTADDPTGPWSDPVTIATSVQYPGLYAPMIHPLSGTSQLSDPDNYLFWNMSIWSNYNVVLMKTDLSPLVVTPV